MNPRFLEKLGSIGAVVGAAACPFCFPLLAAVGSAIGLRALFKYEGVIFYITQALVLVAFIGNIISYVHHRKVFPLILGSFSPVLIFFSFYFYFDQFLIYAGLLGLLTVAVLNYRENRKCKVCGAGKRIS